MSVIHRIVGYNKRSERLALERDVPLALVVEARRIAEAPQDYESAPGAFALSDAAVDHLSKILGFPMSAQEHDWFLEPFEA